MFAHKFSKHNLWNVFAFLLVGGSTATQSIFNHIILQNMPWKMIEQAGAELCQLRTRFTLSSEGIFWRAGLGEGA